ncbi:MAG TPA: 4Fe-4S binding protein [Syntrophomonadaceae bacterium]|nr:4Fe-4S binding protein [Syntrophomonadaceae bacterium]
MQLRRVFQGLALGIFILLMILGKQQLWFLFFLVGVLGAFWWGRFYCAWLCPINTSIEIVDKIYQKLGIKRREVPKWAKNSWVRYFMLILFIATVVVMITTGQKIPVLLILVILGVFLSLFYLPAFWHRYLCPYGTILSFTGNRARKNYFIQTEKCIKCNKCAGVCPADAVIVKDIKEYPAIDKGVCLLCAECALTCPTNAIIYGKQRR